MPRAKRRLLAIVTGLVLALSIGGTVLADHDHRNPRAAANCGANISKQYEKGIVAGGGKKAGIPAPTNCDHFFNTP
jgi:hypothetical protein